MAREQKVSKETVREIARLAAVHIPQERLQQVADFYNSLLPAIGEMMDLDLRDMEPAPVFRHRQEE